MKIAIISSSFFPVIDGVTIAVFNRVKQLSLLGYKVKLFCPDYSVINHIYPNWQDYTGEIFPGIEVINLPSSKSIALDFERDFTPKSYKAIAKKLEQFQPDLIHIDEAERQSFCFFKLPGVKFARQHNIPCVAWFHTNYIDYFDDYFQLPFGLNKIVKNILSLIFTKIYNSYDLTLVSSRTTLQKLEKMGINNLSYGELLGCTISDRKLIDNQEQNNIFLTKQYNLPNLEDKVKLLFLGRLTPDKGWSFTLKCLSNLPSDITSKLAIIVAGDGNLKQEIEQTLKPLISDTYLIGRISHELVLTLLTKVDIFISNSEKETRGLTIIEAAAAGICAIAPRTGGVMDTIDDGKTGLLYEPQNQIDFLEKLELLIDNNTLRKSMGIKAQKLAAQWTWAETTSNLIEIWSTAILKKNTALLNRQSKKKSKLR